MSRCVQITNHLNICNQKPSNFRASTLISLMPFSPRRVPTTTTTFLSLESLLLLPTTVHVRSGSSTAAADPPECCPVVFEGG